MVAPACTPPPVCRARMPVLSAETSLHCALETFRGWCLLSTVVGCAQRSPTRSWSSSGCNTARRATRRPCAVAFCDQLTGRRMRDAGGVHHLCLWMFSSVSVTPVQVPFHRFARWSNHRAHMVRCGYGLCDTMSCGCASGAVGDTDCIFRRRMVQRLNGLLGPGMVPFCHTLLLHASLLL